LEEKSTELNFWHLKSELSSFDCTVEEISLFSCCERNGGVAVLN